MAAACVPYPSRPDRTHYAFTEVPADPSPDTRRTAAQATFTANSNSRGTLEDLTDVAPDLLTEEALCLEIEELCTATLIIDQAFYDIRRKLSDAVKEQKKRVDLYDTCRTLRTQWKEHHRTYKNLLWRSREFAGEAQGTVDDFRELVLPSLRDPERTPEGKQKIIREQIKALQETSQPSQDLCQEFLHFGKALDMYIAEFSRVVESLGISTQTQEVDELEDKLCAAKAAMEAVSQEVKELGWKFAADVAVAGIALLLAFVIPSLWAKLTDVTGIPIDYMKVKTSGLQFFEARRRRDLAVMEYETAKAVYELEKASLCQMVKLESTLYDSRPFVQEVTTKLGVFANVWAAITADIQKLKSSLHRAEDITSQLFIQRVQRLEKMYGYLSQALRYYQITVQLPGKENTVERK